MIHRLILIEQSVENFHKELNTIQKVAVNNGYRSSLIDLLLNKFSLKKTIREIDLVQKQH